MSIFRRLAYNPFEPLARLLEKIDGCVDHVQPMMEAWYAAEFEEVKEHFRGITHAEHEADEIKNSIRESLRRSVFMPLDRWHFLEIISAADKIADRTEDLAYMLTIRRTQVPLELAEHFRELTAKSLECYRELTQSIAHFDKVVESGFSGPVAHEVAERLDHVCHLEWESDKIMYKLSQHLFELEQQLLVMDLLMMHDIARRLGEFADSAEKLAKQVRRTIAG